MEADRTVLMVTSMSWVCELHSIADCTGFVRFNPRPELNCRFPADDNLALSEPFVNNLIEFDPVALSSRLLAASTIGTTILGENVGLATLLFKARAVPYRHLTPPTIAAV